MLQTAILKVPRKKGRHATVKKAYKAHSQMFRGAGLLRLCRRAGGHDPERAVITEPAGALVAQQGAANLAGIVAQADACDLETFRMLVAAEPVGKERRHAVGDRLRIGAPGKFEEGV